MRFSLLISLFLLIALAGCRKKEQFAQVQLIAHAGSGLDVSTSPYCNNSQEAVTYASSMEGMNGVEIDVQLSASHSMWLFHDEFLENSTNGEGCINSVSDTYLETLHYSGWGTERPIRLTELHFPFESSLLFLDVRSANLCTNQLVDQQQVIAAIEAALANKPVTEVRIITNKTAWVHAFFLKGWKVYLNISSASAYEQASVWSETVGLCIRNAEISKEEVASVQNGGKEVLIFEVRSPKGIRAALKKYPDFLMTDNLKAAIIEKYP